MIVWNFWLGDVHTLSKITKLTLIPVTVKNSFHYLVILFDSKLTFPEIQDVFPQTFLPLQYFAWLHGEDFSSGMDVYIRGHTTWNFIKSCCNDFVNVKSFTSTCKARFEQFPELLCCRLLENCACRDIHVYPEMSLVTASQDVCGIRNVYGCISFMQISKKVQMRQGPDCVDTSNSFSPPWSMTWSENFQCVVWFPY